MANYTKSTNFLAKDSLASGDPAKIIKGSEFDVEFNALQTAVNSKANTISPALTGTPTAPTASAGTNTTQIATTEFVLSNSVPSGLIAIWSGSTGTIPTGWVLCNGSNGTPDLRNRFVVGAGSTYAVGATGGSTDAVVVSHTHTATVTDPTHSHWGWGGSVRTNTNSIGGNNDNSTSGSGLVGFETLYAASTGISVSNSTTGVSGTNANLPPYYALCYIMKS